MRQRTKSILLSGVSSIALLSVMGFPNPPKVVELPVADNSVEVPGGQTSICIGFDQSQKKFGQNWDVCPANHAMYGVDDPAGVEGPAEKINAVTSCCPLPSNDILVEENVYVTDSCPDGFVATGRKSEGTKAEPKHLMRCTRINSERYQLGQASPSVYWGTGAAGWKGATRIMWDNIPAGMRYAHGRHSQNEWDVDGCVGYPWGSMLTQKETKYCSGLYFRQLQFRGRGGDPVAGTPVKMFADCDQVSGVDDPAKASCVKNSAQG